MGRPNLTARDAKIASVAARVDELQTNLVEGEVAFHRPGGESGGPRRAAISRVWASTGGPGMWESDWLERQYGKKRILSLKVPGTYCSLLIIDGAVSPFISVAGPYELWRIDGIEAFCNSTAHLEVSNRRVTMIEPGGDMLSILVLDFTRGLSLSYHEEYHGY